MGCNASGKTTLVKLANGLISPDTGTIKILGQNASNNTVAELAASVGVVFQNPGDHLFTDTVEDEIAFGLKLRGLSAGQIMERVNAMLCRFNLEHCHGRSPHDLSMGEKQRLALASIMAYNPPVLLLDEPDRGSEERARQYLISMLGDYSSTGNTVIMVTHDVELVAGFAGRVIMMDKGKIIFDGDKHEVLPESMLYSPQINRLVKRYKHQGVSSKFFTADEVVNAN
jgi:energy-coupling factor transport system ATP-binding protein